MNNVKDDVQFVNESELPDTTPKQAWLTPELKLLDVEETENTPGPGNDGETSS